MYDFYGELLTAHQREIYEALVYDDLSLSEIAEQEGISRQGVHDLLRRVTKTLQSYEDKLHMISRFDRLSAVAEELSALADRAGAEETEQLADALRRLADQLRSDLQ